MKPLDTEEEHIFLTILKASPMYFKTFFDFETLFKEKTQKTFHVFCSGFLVERLWMTNISRGHTSIIQRVTPFCGCQSNYFFCSYRSSFVHAFAGPCSTTFLQSLPQNPSESGHPYWTPLLSSYPLRLVTEPQLLYESGKAVNRFCHHSFTI